MVDGPVHWFAISLWLFADSHILIAIVVLVILLTFLWMSIQIVSISAHQRRSFTSTCSSIFCIK